MMPVAHAALRRSTPRWKSLLLALTGATLLIGSTGCGGALYAVQANSASTKLEEAKAIDAERLAPYEYFMAREHLEKAQEEATHASYGDAIELAEKSETYADKAIKLTRSAHKGAGR